MGLILITKGLDMYSSILSTGYARSEFSPSTIHSKMSDNYIIVISEDTIQVERWKRTGSKYGVSVVGVPNLDAFLNLAHPITPSTPIFIEIGFGEIQNENEIVAYLTSLGFDAAIPVTENCLPDEAIKFARLLFRWQYLDN